MTEKEKMLCGMLYNAYNDKQLVGERLKCKVEFHWFNSLLPSHTV